MGFTPRVGSIPTSGTIALFPSLEVQPGGGKWWREQHIVPLSRQAIEILRELEPLTNRISLLDPGRLPYVFPSARSLQRPMSEARSSPRCAEWATRRTR